MSFSAHNEPSSCNTIKLTMEVDIIANFVEEENFIEDEILADELAPKLHKNCTEVLPSASS